MKLSEIFSELLSAEEQAGANIKSANDEAGKIRFDERAKAESESKIALDETSKEARSILDAAMRKTDDEVRRIADDAKVARGKITELFGLHAEAMMEKLAAEING